MKNILASLPLAMLAPLALGQGLDPWMTTNAFGPPTRPALVWQASGRDGMSTTWQATEQVNDPLTGVVTNVTHQYVEIASGLNYVPDPATGEWAVSEDLIELMPDGSAAALRGPAKLYAKPNLNSPGAITIVTVSNRVFQTRPIGLFWYDPASGSASLIAQLQDCAGELEPPNQIVYRGAFGQVADLRLTYTRWAIESDLVLLQSPQLPAGFDPATARLELWHEWQPMPAPNAVEHLVGPQGETDQVLDFGDLWFPTGTAYWSDGSGAGAANTPAVVRAPSLTGDGTLAPVCKTWLLGATQDVLVEGVVWNEVSSKLASLPPATSGAFPSPIQDRSGWLTELGSGAATSSTSSAVISQGGGYHPTGLVWDYITVPSTCKTNYTFLAGQTYYVSGSCSFGASVTLDPCVIKFNGGSILLMSNVYCNGTSMNPTVLTSWQDDLFGVQIQQKSACPTNSANPALLAWYVDSNLSFTGLRFRWAVTGMTLLASGCGTYTYTISDCSFEFCQTAVNASLCSVAISGSTMCGVATPTVLLWYCTYLTGSLTDICTGDSDGNGAPDITEYQYFGGLGTLPGNVLGGVTTRTAGHNPTSDEHIWSTRSDSNGAYGTYVYNTSCWLYGVTGLRAFSPWNSVGGPQGAGTLITPRHAITISHMAYATNTAYRFVDANNVSHQVTYLYGESLPDVDYWVMVFDQDLPSNVGYVRVLPDAVRHKLTPTMEEYGDPCYFSRSVPAVACNQDKDAFVYDLYFLGPGYGAYFQHSQWFPGWGSACYRGGGCYCCPGLDWACGDSGSPTFLLVSGELALIGPAYQCSVASWPGQFFDELNSTIYNLDAFVSNKYNTNAMTGYTATPYPVDTFPDLW